MDRLLARLARPWVPWAAVVVAVVLASGSLTTPLLADDYLLWATHEGLWGDWRGPWTLFRYFPDDPTIRQGLMDRGVLSWWAHPDLHLCFWRPVASITHWLDFEVFGKDPVGHHAHQLLWYGAMLGAGVAFYRQVLGVGWVAGLAAILFAFDDVHGVAVGWVASRNLLIATAFGALAVAAHDRWRQGGGWTWAVVAPGLLVFAVLSAEAGVAMFGYFVAYALCLERGPLSRRLVTLVPSLGVVLAWRVAYRVLGYGVVGSGHYLDPVMAPLDFVARVVSQVPVLVMGHLAASPLDGLVVFPDALPIMLVVAGLWLAWLWAAYSDRIKLDPKARFFFLGMAITSIPLATGVPQDRLLTPVALGGFGLIALCIQSWRQGRGGWGAGVLAGVWLVFHGLVSPLAIPTRAQGIPALGGLSMQVTDAMPAEPDQTVVLVNLPFDVVTYYPHPMRAYSGEAVPGSLRLLYSGFEAARLERTSQHTVELTPERGFLRTWRERILRSMDPPFAVGERVEVSGMVARVMEVAPDGRPARVAFTFEEELDSLTWRFYDGSVVAELDLPAVGDGVDLPAFDIFEALHTTTGEVRARRRSRE